MTQSAALRCRCGKVRGHVLDAAPGNVNRMICYCDDCQAYLHYLKRSELLDEHGGSDVVQVAPAKLMFDQGTEQIAGLRLSSKGLFRWYARCCHTPLGNTWPHPFFDRKPQAPTYSVHVISKAERDALRPLCGPTATAVQRG